MKLEDFLDNHDLAVHILFRTGAINLSHLTIERRWYLTFTGGKEVFVLSKGNFVSLGFDAEGPTPAIALKNLAKWLSNKTIKIVNTFDKAGNNAKWVEPCKITV